MKRALTRLVLLVFCSCSSASTGELGVDGFRCEVYEVRDGDTIRCGMGRVESEKIRLIGIYAPELRQANGEEAHQALLEMVPTNSWITLTFGANLRGKYGRVLAYLVTDTGLNVNLEMVRLGWTDTNNNYPFKLWTQGAPK